MSDETRRQNAETFSENRGRLVAEFFRRFPRADPRRLRLITRALGDVVIFYLEYTARRRKVAKAKRSKRKKR